MKKITFEEYTVNNRYIENEYEGNHWFYSPEKQKQVPNGTVRWVHGVLFYSDFESHFDFTWRYEGVVCWRPCDQASNTLKNRNEFLQKVLGLNGPTN